MEEVTLLGEATAHATADPEGGRVVWGDVRVPGGMRGLYVTDLKKKKKKGGGVRGARRGTKVGM